MATPPAATTPPDIPNGKEGTGMATDAVRRGRAGTGSRVIGRLTTETKHSLKTTEFWAMVAIIVGILLASLVVGQGDGNGNGNVDAFPAVRPVEQRVVEKIVEETDVDRSE
jgi:hypothetical protein